jgi:ketosteroid isomerase-like protein
MTNEHKPIQAVLDSFFEKFGKGDLPGLLELFAGTVDFNVSGSPNVPWTGRRSTRVEISQFFQILPKELAGPERFALKARLVDGTDAVVIAESVWRVLSTGKIFTSAYALHLTVEDGRITRYHMYEDSYAIAQAFTE